MSILLVVAVVVILLSLAGFAGIIARLRDAAWAILVVGLVLLVLAIVL